MYWRVSNCTSSDPAGEPQSDAGSARSAQPARRLDLIHLIATYVPPVLVLLWNWRLFLVMVGMALLVGLWAAWSQRGCPDETDSTNADDGLAV